MTTMQTALSIGSFAFGLIMIILSYRQNIDKTKRCYLLGRHISGFVVGLLDQLLMILFNFQEKFLFIVLVFNYTAYTFWTLLMPINRLIESRRNIMLWILFSASINTIFEHVSLLILTYYQYGIAFLPYPTEPIRWTTLHTFIFYLFIHSLATLIVLIFASGLCLRRLVM